ncbi:MAG: 50S ribosomal protein L24 [Chlamydiia bacterium]|nr:50S ribosomal protein L24 [Chlamydiia bacterium]
MSNKLRKGDPVIVITGNDKGKTGKILSCDEKRVVVEGVNIRKKHMKKKQENQRSQIIDIEAPVDLSNVKYCHDGKPFKLRVKEGKNGRELFILDNGKEVVIRQIKQGKSK